MGIACSNASARTTRSLVSRRQKTEAFSHLLKLPDKATENKLGLSLEDIRVFPTNLLVLKLTRFWELITIWAMRGANGLAALDRYVFSRACR